MVATSGMCRFDGEGSTSSGGGVQKRETKRRNLVDEVERIDLRGANEG